jgi:hypothetical protein
MTEPRPPIEQLLEFALFAPIGVALALFDNLPSVKPIGLKEVNQQISSARMIGAMTVNQARREIEKLLTPKPAGPSATAPIETVAVSPLPIADYDSLTAAQIIGSLDTLTPAERRRIAEHERAHRNRRTVLGRLDQLSA